MLQPVFSHLFGDEICLAFQIMIGGLHAEETDLSGPAGGPIAGNATLSRNILENFNRQH
jgi:hypothetical protein